MCISLPAPNICRIISADQTFLGGHLLQIFLLPVYLNATPASPFPPNSTLIALLWPTLMRVSFKTPLKVYPDEVIGCKSFLIGLFNDFSCQVSISESVVSARVVCSAHM